MASSFNCLAADLNRSLTTLDEEDDVGGRGNNRPLTHKKMYERIPKKEIKAYYAKLKESQGFDVSGFPNAYIYGTIVPMYYDNYLSDEDLELVTRLARSALACYKELNQDYSYEFLKLVMANKQFVVAGVWYYITFSVNRTTSSSSSHRRPTFQAMVLDGLEGELLVKICRRKPTTDHSDLQFANSQTPEHHHNEACLSKKDSHLYYRMLAESEGFDVPDIPNSSEVPGLFRPMKYTDDVKKLRKLCKLSADHYNMTKQVSCKFVEFLKANKREGPYGEDYHIELLVMHKNGEYQTLQARVCWDKGGVKPCVELCREKRHDGVCS